MQDMDPLSAIPPHIPCVCKRDVYHIISKISILLDIDIFFILNEAGPISSNSKILNESHEMSFLLGGVPKACGFGQKHTIEFYYMNSSLFRFSMGTYNRHYIQNLPHVMYIQF